MGLTQRQVDNLLGTISQYYDLPARREQREREIKNAAIFRKWVVQPEVVTFFANYEAQIGSTLVPPDTVWSAINAHWENYEKGKITSPLYDAAKRVGFDPDEAKGGVRGGYFYATAEYSELTLALRLTTKRWGDICDKWSELTINLATSTNTKDVSKAVREFTTALK